MQDNKRDKIIKSEKLSEFETNSDYDAWDKNSVIKRIFEIRDEISYDILKEELLLCLEEDAKPLFLDPEMNNVVRIISENINNIELEGPDEKHYLNKLKNEIRTIVIDYLNQIYDINYNINENETFIDLEPIADLYEFFVLRKVNNMFNYYYSIISLTFFDKMGLGDEKEDLVEALREYLINLNPGLVQEEDPSDETIKITLLGDFFNNKDFIINSGISNVVGMSSFLNFLTMFDEGEEVTDRIKEMFYNFGGYEGIEYDDNESFKKYIDCLGELKNANELLVLLASKILLKENI